MLAGPPNASAADASMSPHEETHWVGRRLRRALSEERLAAIGQSLAFALQLLAPGQLGGRWLLRSADGGCLYLAIAHVSRVNDSIW